MKEIHIPHNLQYRDYQKGIIDFIRKGGKRAVLNWHRRAGKDKTFFNLLVEQAIKEVGGYAYVLPTYAQGKKIIWDSIDKQGFKFKDHIPKEILESENGTELKFTLSNGSFIQILGSENIDSLRGISPKGILFSEYAFQNPTVWDIMKPILAENGGWAIFNSTPNGKNHFFDMYQMASNNPNWYCQKLSIEDTGAVTSEYIQQEREDGMSEEMIQQEYYCSFNVGAVGSYYANQLAEANSGNRITELPVNKYKKVDVYIDIGANDKFTLWFKQDDGQFFNFIHYFEDNGEMLEYYYEYIEEFLEKKGLKLGFIYIPHDGKNKAHSFLVSGETIYDNFEKRFGKEKIKYVERPKSVNDGIQAVRKIFNRVRIDTVECKQGLRCLENYKKRYDDKRKIFLDQPLHDWASHGADGFRYFAIVEGKEKKIKKKHKIVYTSLGDVI